MAYFRQGLSEIPSIVNTMIKLSFVMLNSKI